MNISKIVLAFTLALTACDSSGSDGSGGSDAVEASSCSSAYDGVPRVVAAYLKRIELAHGGTSLIDPLMDRARAAVDMPEVEEERELHAIDHLVRGYLAPFVRVAGVPASTWLDTLPSGQLTPDQAHDAALSALLQTRTRLSARPAQPWVAVYNTVASGRVGVIHHGNLGEPVTWYVPAVWFGSVDVFQAAWDAALEAGYDAGQAAWDAAPKGTPEETEAAVGAAINAVLGANASVFAEIEAATVAEADALIDMR